MPRIKKFNPKRAFRGNKYTKTRQNMCSDNSDTEKCSFTTASPKNSASKKKLVYLDTSEFISNTCENINTSGNIVVDLEILSNFINKFVKCKFCGSENSMTITESKNARKGLATKLNLGCSDCDIVKSTMTSNVTRNRFYEVNCRLVYGMRCIGKGRKSAQTFCAVMNLPPPPFKFSVQNKILSESAKEVAEASMRTAAIEAVAQNGGNRNVVGAFDGSWQKRGHTSLNGVVSATSLDSGKILDVEVLSKHCDCNKSNESKEHKCTKNYDGYSGGMEVEGVFRIFHRSEESRNVRFVQYLGDGDSKAFQKVEEARPYGEGVEIEKLECVGHVQKRMGTRLRKVVKNYKGQKVCGKTGIGGAGRLTNLEIEKFQQYYGLAIRRNCGDLQAMRRAVWATFFHKLSTDTTPQHGLCPKGFDSWCKYQKALAGGKPYQHKHSLPDYIMNIIKPTFRDLSDDKLLKKCTHGRTQNPNESFNSSVWQRVPKTVFVRIDALKLGVMDAVITFNDGSISRTKVLQNMGIQPGDNMVEAFTKIDSLRVAEADRAAEQMTKEARTKRRMQKRKRDDAEEETQDEYGAGMF